MILRYTPAAREDLFKINNYIENVLKNSVAAKNITNKIIKKCSILKEQPMCGFSLDKKLNIKSDLRILVCDNYLVFYQIQEKYISVVRILDGRTDYLSVLFK